MATNLIVWLTNQNDDCSPFQKDKLFYSVKFFKHICLQGWLNKHPFPMQTCAKKVAQMGQVLYIFCKPTMGLSVQITQ